VTGMPTLRSKSPVRLGLLPSLLALAPRQGVGAAAYASGPAPAGYRWSFVTFLGERVTYLGAPVVALEAVNG
jgi:hypothetical protein